MISTVVVIDNLDIVSRCSRTENGIKDDIAVKCDDITRIIDSSWLMIRILTGIIPCRRPIKKVFIGAGIPNQIDIIGYRYTLSGINRLRCR
ncbi:hypothetical protein SDC9_139781 [bioreactor metagenome]|uniref:Uncharacterized protein n=1 Tax=bioreactor metagenome TaxID=1076179 RepID=A0A645DTI5_9ZZZZ